MTRLAGAHVLITGGSEGIGLETARLCLAHGARVSIVSRSAAKLAAAAADLGLVGTAAADVTDEAALAAAVADLVARSGRCDVLVACAGGAEQGRFLEVDTALLRRQLELNYLGAVHVVRAVLPAMVAASRGHVVLVSSVAGLVGVYGYGGYGPAKAALQNLAEVLEAEHGDDGITVGVCYPPDTLTPGFAHENLTKPAETAAVSALVKPVSAARVAAALVRGIEKDHALALCVRLPEGPAGPCRGRASTVSMGALSRTTTLNAVRNADMSSSQPETAEQDEVAQHGSWYHLGILAEVARTAVSSLPAQRTRTRRRHRLESCLEWRRRPARRQPGPWLRDGPPRHAVRPRRGRHASW